MPPIPSKVAILYSRGVTMFASRILRKSILIITTLAGLACGDYSRLTSPSSDKPKVLPQSANVRASFSRYILISGVWVCVDCPTEANPASSNSTDVTLPVAQ